MVFNPLSFFCPLPGSFPGISRGRPHRGGLPVSRLPSRSQSAGVDILPAPRLLGGDICVHRRPERKISQLEQHRRLCGFGDVHCPDLLLPGHGEGPR